MAVLITTSGDYREVEPKNGMDFSLEELQKFVHGAIDILGMDNGMIMVINDEGKFTEEENIEATKQAAEHGAIFYGDYIAGDVLICNDEEVQ